MFTIQDKHEDELRLRLDFELKINKLHNLNVALRNHEITLNRNIEQLEHDLKECRLRIKIQQEEIVELRSWKAHQEQIKRLDDVKIECVQQNEVATK